MGSRTGLRVWEKSFAILLIHAAVIILLYGDTWDYPFVFDDYYNIVANPNIRITDLDLSSLKQAWHGSPRRDIYSRPLYYFSLAINYYFNGLDVAGYHLVNLFLLLFSAWFFYLWLVLLLQSPALRKEMIFSPRLSALFVSLIWLCHPVLVQGVTFITNRIFVLTALFANLTLYCYLSAIRKTSLGRRGIWYLIALLSYLAALAVREAALVLPFVVIAIEVFCAPGGKVKAKKSRGRVIILGIVALASFLAFMTFLPKGAAGPFNAGFIDSLSMRFLTQFRVVIFYLAVLILPLPARLNLDYDFTLSSSLWHPPATLLAMGLLLIFLACIFIRGRRAPLFALGAIWFFLWQAFDSSGIPAEPIFLKRLFLPSMGVALFGVIYLLKLLEALPRRGLTASLIMALILISLGTITRMRNDVYGSAVSLWADAARKSPQKTRPRFNLAQAYRQAGMPDAARRELRLVEQVMPQDSLREIAELARTYWLIGDRNETLRVLNQGLSLHPNAALLYEERGEYYFKWGGDGPALADFLRAIELGSSRSQVYLNAGIIYKRQGETAKAGYYFLAAAQVDEACVRCRAELARLTADLGQSQNARKYIDQALRIDPDDLWVNTYLLEILALTKDYGELDANLKRLTEKKATTGQRHYYLGLKDYYHRNFSPAERHLRIAWEALKEFRPAGEYLSRALGEQGKYRQAGEVLNCVWRLNQADYHLLKDAGAAFYLGNDLPAAAELFSRYLQRQPLDATVQLKLVESYYRLGRYQEARAQIENAQNLPYAEPVKSQLRDYLSRLPE